MRLTKQQIASGFYLGYSDIELANEKFVQIKGAFLSKQNISVDQTKKELKERLCAIIGKLKPPIAVCHSGGVDSTLMLCMARECFKTKKIYVCRVGYSNSADEVFASNAICNKLEVPNSCRHTITIYPWMVKEIVGSMGEDNYRSWFYSSSLIPTTAVYEATKGVSAVSVVTGDGGDEIFCGYDRYLFDYYFKKVGWPLQHIPFKKTRRMQKVADYNKYGYEALVRLWPLELLSDLLSYEVGNIPMFDNKWVDCFYADNGQLAPMHKLDRLMLFDIGTELYGVELKKVDTAATIAGVEVTSPLMDWDLMLWAASLPVKCKYRSFTRKWLMRELIKDYIPDYNKMSKKKRGFSVPVGQWFRKELNGWLYEQTRELHGLNRVVVSKLVAEHVSGKVDHAEKLWGVVIWCVLNRKGVIRGVRK